jgi:hypothetical protein
MSKIRIKQHAPAGSTYAPGAFDSQIGRNVRLELLDGAAASTCRIMDAHVSHDGKVVTLTIDIPDGVMSPVLADARLPVTEDGS